MPENTVVIGEYYIEERFLKMIKNEVRESICTENRRAARQIQRERDLRRVEMRAKRKYFANQKLYGVIWIFLVMILTMLIGDPVCAVLAVPGIGLVVSRKMLIVNEYYRTHGGIEQWKGM